MDRSWMKAPKLDDQFLNGVEEFLAFAMKSIDRTSDGKIRCPCVRCGNLRKYSIEDTRIHLHRYGMDVTYTRWYWHGENVIPSSTSTKYQSFREEVGDNDLRDMMDDLETRFVDRPEIFEKIVNEAETPLYEGCGLTKLSAVLNLWNIKVSGGWSDSSFTSLLEFIHQDLLPKHNKIPQNTYEAKKSLSTLGMNYEKIHACPNDCILYRNSLEDLDECSTCGASRWKKGKKPIEGKKGVPAKVLWYIPPEPRFERWFRNTEIAEHMVWHDEKRINDGKLRHPADAAQWKTFNAIYPQFGAEPRNLRLTLSSDGMNPHGTLSSRYSVWPVMLVNYNLPPQLCMKRKFMMLTLLISGPSQPGNNIDVYLQPLIDDLKRLWDDGVRVYDAYRQETFTLRAMLIWTVSDFPAYGNLSGYAVRSSLGCPVCMNDTLFTRLSHGKKTVFLDNRRFLPILHRYRKQRRAFNGLIEGRRATRPLTGEQVFDIVKNINVIFGKRKTTGQLGEGPWKKRSIFFELPYWKSLLVRHCLDVMHIEKNVCEAIVGTMLDMKGKTKDGRNARLDLKEMKIRANLAPQMRNERLYLPPAPYTLSRQEKRMFCQWLSSIKVPEGFSSNFRNLVSLKDLKLIGMKTHDCHTLMQQLLPLAIRAIMTKEVRYAITRFCLFFNSICKKVIDPNILDDLQSELVVTLCMLEKYFPPSFFDIMIHLTLHLVREVKLGGPVYLRWMYPFERYMKVLKSYVKNRNRPEGCIVERYIVEESVEVCSDYLKGMTTIGLPKHGCTMEARVKSVGTPTFVSPESLAQAHLYVLHNSLEVTSLVDVHLREIRVANPKKSKNEKWLQEEHNRTFSYWIKEYVYKKINGGERDRISKDLFDLSRAPSAIIIRYTAYSVNGYTFYTRERDEKHPVQNSGVSLRSEALHISSAKDKNPIYGSMTYYGFIEDIWELDYCGLRVVVFKCRWADNNHVIVDDDGITVVDFRRLGYRNEPFIMASQAIQVFYVPDPKNMELSLVIQMKARIIKEDGEDEDDDSSNIPSFTRGLPNADEIDVDEDDVSNLVRSDVEWTLVENSRKKKRKK